jgi:hypothetical protein
MLGGADDDETARRHARALRGEEARPAA